MAMQVAVHRLEHAEEYAGPQAADRLRMELVGYKLAPLRKRALLSGCDPEAVAEAMATPEEEGGAHKAVVELVVERCVRARTRVVAAVCVAVLIAVR